MKALIPFIIYIVFVMSIILIGYLKWAFMDFCYNPVGWTVIYRDYRHGRLCLGVVIDHHDRDTYPTYLVKCSRGVSEQWILKKRCWFIPF